MLHGMAYEDVHASWQRFLKLAHYMCMDVQPLTLRACWCQTIDNANGQLVSLPQWHASMLSHDCGLFGQVPFGQEEATHPKTGMRYKLRWIQDEAGKLSVCINAVIASGMHHI